MPLIIDGYNLLHATDIFGAEPGNFQQSREALLAFLGAALEVKERRETVIVFDAAQAPPGLPGTVTYEQIIVRYARNYPDADALIEELIERHPATRSLLVVSSDHRVQRAARRGGAKWIDSQLWYSDLWKRRVQARQQQMKSLPEKPIGALSPQDIAYWVQQFGGDESEETTQQRSPRVAPSPKQKKNPFPPGYGEDLLQGDSDV